jgi:hypothetical protein
MTRTGRFVGLLLLSLLLACSSKSALNVRPNSDGGEMPSSEAGLADTSANTLEVSVVPDMAPDVVTQTPDTSKNDSVPPMMDVAPDLSLSDVNTVINPDVTGDKSDAYTYFDIRLDAKLPPDGIDIVGNPDAAGDTLDAYTSLLDIRLDGKSPPDLGPDTAKTDSMKDLGSQGEVGVMVSGVEVLPYMNYGTADTTCVAATASWLDSLTTYLAEDRKCWADSDCNYVSFSNSCGQVCPVPMNVQRVGEFAKNAIGDLDPKCSTCPVLTDYPSCPAPPGDGSVICSNNVCVWK